MMSKKKREWKLSLEIVPSTGVKDIQKKINQWVTAKTYIRHRVTPLADGSMLFEILLYKTS